jgi:hypothetical protein
MPIQEDELGAIQVNKGPITRSQTKMMFSNFVRDFRIVENAFGGNEDHLELNLVKLEFQGRHKC